MLCRFEVMLRQRSQTWVSDVYMESCGDQQSKQLLIHSQVCRRAKMMTTDPSVLVCLSCLIL